MTIPDLPSNNPFQNLLNSVTSMPFPWLQAFQEKARKEFQHSGLPSVKSENWRYTNLKDLEKISWSHPSSSDKFAPPPSLDPDIQFLVVVNGQWRPHTPTMQALPKGVKVYNLSTSTPQVEKELGQIASLDLSPLVALNTALFEDAVIIHIAENTKVEKPLHVHFLTITEDQAIVASPRLIIVAEKGAQATIIEEHKNVGKGIYFSNSVIEVFAEAESHLQHYFIQQESSQGFHISTCVVRLEQDAVCDSFILHTGGKLARREVHTILNGQNIDYRLNGAYIARDTQHCDITTFINHAQPHCRSREVVKGVIDDQARAVFYGKIKVAPGAQKTDGYQLNKALLLSDTAEIDSRPELEIYADDVKCSHGATAGELDDQALFYLRSRGIDDQTARQLLIEAFLNEAIDEVQNEEVKAYMKAVVTERTFS